MIVKAIYKDKDFDYFNDKVTGVQRKYGDIFECDDEIAQERIKNKFVKKATKEEEKAYIDSIDTNDDGDIIKPLEECTMEELIEIAQNENIELLYPKGNTAQTVIIEKINKVRAERLKQSNGGEE